MRSRRSKADGGCVCEADPAGALSVPDCPTSDCACGVSCRGASVPSSLAAAIPARIMVIVTIAAHRSAFTTSSTPKLISDGTMSVRLRALPVAILVPLLHHLSLSFPSMRVRLYAHHSRPQRSPSSCATFLGTRLAVDASVTIFSQAGARCAPPEDDFGYAVVVLKKIGDRWLIVAHESALLT